MRNRCVGIVDYQAGNVRSIENAFEYLGATVVRIRAEGDLDGVTHVLLPGVGAFGYCAEKLRGSGLVPALSRWAIGEGRPMLGICVGMQLLADVGEELGRHEGLGWIGGTVRRLDAAPPEVRVPHVGWNSVTFEDALGEFAAGDSADFYFDHSYAFHAPVHGTTLGSCAHGIRFSAIVRRGNLIASQFHPEKSQESGLRFLRSFLQVAP